MNKLGVLMNNIAKLAKILNADVIFLDSVQHTTTFLYKNNRDSNNDIHDFLLNKLDLVLSHSYTSVDYDLGHVVVCKINPTQLICFSFSYKKNFTDNNELIHLHSLQNLKTIAQIIFTMYNTVEAPDEDIYILKIDNKKPVKTRHFVPFDSQLFFDTETDIIKAIVYSKKDQLSTALDSLAEFNLVAEHLTANNIIRGEKNTLISYISILNRAIIQWGYPAKLAFQLQYSLVQEVELSPQFLNFFQTIKEISWHYFSVIKQYRFNNFLPLHQRIKQYIKQHIRENITLDDIATGLNASKKTLNPAFKKEYGVTITQFIRQTKVETAKELLISSNLSLLEIAELLSFSTATYFVKTFKKVTGVTPNHFRKHFITRPLDD